ncbi:MAG: type II CRISPR-associated endonuclease Cas1 [Rikenellaceae bacterium]
MIKRTLYFGNPAYLSLSSKQMVVKLPEVEKAENMTEKLKYQSRRTIPIEDIGVVVLDDSRITITQPLIGALLENNTALITCNKERMPIGLMLPLNQNSVQSERFRAQIEVSQPLKKQIWQQTIQSKIENQAAVLREKRGVEVRNMLAWVKDVRSGDSENLEGRAAAYYWKNLFPSVAHFTRGRDDMPPNNLLNYGYAILRAVVARALVSSGLLPTLGVHHHNKYNAYCLADDIMEPYRPYVDQIVIDIVDSGEPYDELTKDLKAKLLSIPITQIVIGGKRSPLMVGVAQTTASLARCFEGEARKVVYPTLL